MGDVAGMIFDTGCLVLSMATIGVYLPIPVQAHDRFQ